MFFLCLFGGEDFPTSESEVFPHKMYLFQQVAQPAGLDEFDVSECIHYGRVLLKQPSSIYIIARSTPGNSWESSKNNR